MVSKSSGISSVNETGDSTSECGNRYLSLTYPQPRMITAQDMLDTQTISRGLFNYASATWLITICSEATSINWLRMKALHLIYHVDSLWWGGSASIFPLNELFLTFTSSLHRRLKILPIARMSCTATIQTSSGMIPVISTGTNPSFRLQNVAGASKPWKL